MEKDLLEKIADLHVQATTERSHYYVGSILRECSAEIMRLRELLSPDKLKTPDYYKLNMKWLLGK